MTKIWFISAQFIPSLYFFVHCVDKYSLYIYIYNNHQIYRFSLLVYFVIGVWEKKGEPLNFEKKKIRAEWLAPKNAADYEKLPRIFISELKLEEQNDRVKQIIYKYDQSIPENNDNSAVEMVKQMMISEDTMKQLPW